MIFLHIPKAAGTTLGQILKRQHGHLRVHSLDGVKTREAIQRFAGFSKWRRGYYKAIQGHLTYGFHELVPHECSYVTILRDPVDRIVSHYYYALRFPGHYLYEHLNTNRISLHEYALSRLTVELDNGMTRAVAGVEVPHGQCSQELFNTAVANIDRHFAMVGVAERFDEMIMLLQNQFSWKTPYYVRENVTPNRPKLTALDDATRQAIESTNRFDRQLYELAKRRFEELVKANQPGLSEQLEHFRRRNEAYTGVKLLIRKAKYTIFPPHKIKPR